MPGLLVAARLLVASVFLAAVVGKSVDGDDFGRFVATMFDRLARPVAAGTLAGEAVVVLLLLAPGVGRWGVPAGFGVALLLLAAFSAALSTALRRQVQVPCGCFGVSAGPPAGRHVLRNGALAVVAAAGLGGSLAARPAASPTESIAAGALGVALAVAVVALDEIRALFVPSKSLRG
jgi:hypothetical protein